MPALPFESGVAWVAGITVAVNPIAGPDSVAEPVEAPAATPVAEPVPAPVAEPVEAPPATTAISLNLTIWLITSSVSPRAIMDES